jgi:hypothetical protein
MEPYPELRTARLSLREFSLEDAPEVQHLVGEWEVARPLLIVPHPYEDGMAEEWIATHRGRKAGALQEVGNLRGSGGLRATGSRLAQEQTRVAYTKLLRTASRNCPKRFAGACGVALRATETVLFGSF